MTPIYTLMGLLVLVYMGSFVFGGHAIRGFGLPSSAEYVVLGFLIGPSVLGLLDHDTIVGFDPLTNAAIGWLALVVGLSYGFVGSRRVRLRSLIAGSLLAIVTGGAIFGALDVLLFQLSTMRAVDRWLLAGGAAVACAETTRHAVRWVVERHGAKGPLADLVAEFSDADDLVVVLAMTILFALRPPETTAIHLPTWGWGIFPIGLGIVMGLLATALLGKEFRLDESWGVLLGTSVMTIGLSARVGISPITTLFVMGTTIAATSRHRTEILAMATPTERAILLPALVLAGARVDFSATRLLPAVVAVTIAIRVVSKGIAGSALRFFLPRSDVVSPYVGFGLLSTGGLAMSIGLAFALRFPGEIGDTVLATAAAVTVFGEFIGPPTLRAVLRAAGEIPEEKKGTTPVAPRAEPAEAEVE